jgi:hypothetical protein
MTIIEAEKGEQGWIVFPALVLAIPLRQKTRERVLSFLRTVTVFGTSVEISLSELTLEAFYLADQVTARILGAAK